MRFTFQDKNKLHKYGLILFRHRDSGLKARRRAASTVGIIAIQIFAKNGLVGVAHCGLV